MINVRINLPQVILFMGFVICDQTHWGFLFAMTLCKLQYSHILDVPNLM